MILPLLVPLTVGAIPVGIVLGSIGYVVSRSGVEAYQAQRRKLLADRAAARKENQEDMRLAEMNAVAMGVDMAKEDAR